MRGSAALPVSVATRIGLQSGAADHEAGLDRADRRDQLRDAAPPLDPRHLVMGADLAAAPLDQFGVLAGDRAVIDDAGHRGIDRLDAGAVRLDLAEALRADQFQTRHAVRDAALVEILEARQFVLLGRDDHLADHVVGDAVLLAEVDQLLLAGHAEARFQRAGRVVDAGVQDAAVMAGLMLADLALFLQQHQPQARPAVQQFQRRRQPDDPAADDRDVPRSLCHPVPLLRARAPLSFR